MHAGNWKCAEEVCKGKKEVKERKELIKVPLITKKE